MEQTEHEIYLDNAATTRVLPEVLNEMVPYFSWYFGNPGSVHSVGASARRAVELARERVAAFIGASCPEDILFTSGGSEANAMALTGSRKWREAHGAPLALIGATEHDSVVKAARSLPGYLTVLPNVYGRIQADAVEERLSEIEGIGLVSVMAVNNETGAESDVAAIGKICARHGVLFHTDAVQAAGGYPIDVGEIGCDFLSLSAHKLHGPKGIGALYDRRHDVLSPLIFGGDRQEYGLRGGTENVPGIVGFGKACEIASQNRRKTLKKVSLLRELFYTVTAEKLAAANRPAPAINGEPLIAGGKILNLRFEGVDAETLLLMLDNRGICVSAGSACHGGETKPSGVLLAMGLTPSQASGSIRVSFSAQNTEADVRTAAEALADCVLHIEEMKK